MNSNKRLRTICESINHAYLEDEVFCINRLLEVYQPSKKSILSIQKRAAKLVTTVRSTKKSQKGIEAFLHEYDLTSDEGVVLMCLAEALLRVPDDLTADILIREKLAEANWEKHLGNSQSLFVNASTWALMLSGKILKPEKKFDAGLDHYFSDLIAKLGDPVLRVAIKQAMRILGKQFVMGIDIKSALARSYEEDNASFRYSFDMLGEAAKTADDAESYYTKYRLAILEMASEPRLEKNDSSEGFFGAPSISVKLSALLPRYEVFQNDQIVEFLLPKVMALAELACSHALALTLDAEESDRLNLSLLVFECVLSQQQFANWNGLGIAVQAYQKRAFPVLNWLRLLAEKTRHCIPVRLVKGAYWDTEIKRAHEQGLNDFPVFTRKANTDLSYLACAQYLLQNNAYFYPQFATHNAHTIAAVTEMTLSSSRYEFQKLHGMGDALYSKTVGKNGLDVAVRVYAPVGSYQELLPYLVRRLLENGANTSFVNRIEHELISIEEIIEDPVSQVKSELGRRNKYISLPLDLFQPDRKNSPGFNLDDFLVNDNIERELSSREHECWHIGPIINGSIIRNSNAVASFEKFNIDKKIGSVVFAEYDQIESALQSAKNGFQLWHSRTLNERSCIFERAADLLEQHCLEMVSLIVREGGRCISDALSEVREAIDFCRYYAFQARRLFSSKENLPGPTGEINTLSLHGRGVFVCISPWNFPLAIFMGQIVAALVSGNSVIAKPASATPIVAFRAVQLLLEAGVPNEVLQFLPAKGKVFSKIFTQGFAIGGVAFTGSLQTARWINTELALKHSTIIPIIAETGGQNVMLVDSTALPEQVVTDAIFSAFNSAGQRCSALRVIVVQEDIALKVKALLIGSMEQLIVGSPNQFKTDVGPVISEQAKNELNNYIAESARKLVYQVPIDHLSCGHYVSPSLLDIAQLSELTVERFGPILHFYTYKAEELDDVINQINSLGFGLTFGIHSRISSKIDYIIERINVGNIYVNRNMIGATVGVQPFGGQGLSGTGLKAGGPHYLQQFVTEKTVSNNVTAMGGNASLLALSDSS